MLAVLAQYHPRTWTRVAAVDRLTDQKALAAIAQTAANWGFVRRR
jgi:hypothetical protein